MTCPGWFGLVKWFVLLTLFENGCDICYSPVIPGSKLGQTEPPGSLNSSLKDHNDDSPPDFFTPVSPDPGDQEFLLLAKPTSQPPDPKVLKVAIIGTPNAGKSTLINNLLGRRICAVSQKVHTTRTKALAVITHKKTQMVLLDTPGMISFSQGRKHKLPRSLLVDAKNTLLEADLIAVLVDVSNQWTNMKLDPEVLLQLQTHHSIPSVLVLNKVDALKNKHSLFEITDALTEGVVDGQTFVTRRQKGEESSSSKLPHQQNSSRSAGNEDEWPHPGHDDLKHEDGLSRQHEHDVRINDSDAPRLSFDEGTSASEGSEMEDDVDGQRDFGRNSSLGEAGQSVKAPDNKSISAQNHDRLDAAAVEVQGIQGDGLREDAREMGESHTSYHSSDGSMNQSNHVDSAKQDILKEYASNLLEFVDDPERVRAEAEEDPKVVAERDEEERRLRRMEMEREREERRRLWKTAQMRSGWGGFKAVFMISALHGDGVTMLKEFLLSSARPGSWEYHEDVVTNLTPAEILQDAIREKLLETLPQEVPYTITQETEVWQTGPEGELQIMQALICRKKSHLRMLEKKVGWIARQATQDLMDAFHCEVKLSIQLKLKK
ncbi:GTPase Era, mitochondrial-like [Diadema antillarum]|uniref:GTPase Era, mitochondrial-like n=1 Tax=Diadema antillarum TaxID=105358 RepID=UPI003A8BB20D